ncbi:hypothetical protein RDI58_020630 [Solanum bulbocastanum]|uniref:Uncharacterized protein n=1 Tax=Solanum bulbocastanum TaxID=147425 RepID=A0AAN8T7H9_SOLBU
MSTISGDRVFGTPIKTTQEVEESKFDAASRCFWHWEF